MLRVPGTTASTAVQCCVMLYVLGTGILVLLSHLPVITAAAFAATAAAAARC